ncbi:site-specific DNA-methyltransferase [Janibacter cremeus]|uniref:site-specific DNA-methyltransferase n=1 Tax=Janibacter cremeus TaxID=1285192 RepID=UPI003D65847D
MRCLRTWQTSTNFPSVIDAAAAHRQCSHSGLAAGVRSWFTARASCCRTADAALPARAQPLFFRAHPNGQRAPHRLPAARLLSRSTLTLRKRMSVESGTQSSTYITGNEDRSPVLPRQLLPSRQHDHGPAPSAELVWPGKTSVRTGSLASVASSARAAWDLRGKLVRGEQAENLLIQGDASRALSELLSATAEQSLAGRVKLCYLDPPYNTGERFAHYADKADRAQWLTTLHDHLVLAREFLAPDGSLWLHLDDSEQHRARCVLDEVFGEDCFVATIVWQKRTTRENRKAFSSMHDYIHVYAPAGPKAWKKVRNGLPDEGAFSNPDNDPRGPWRSVPMNVQAGHATAGQIYTLVTPTGAQHDPPPGRCWTYTAERLAELNTQGRVYWPRGGNGKPRLKRFQNEVTGLAPFTVWTADEVGDTGSAKRALLADFPNRQVFDTPKPVGLLERIVGIATDPGDLVLDFYLGSGTTAVASQRLGRRWVGIETSARTIEEFALPRLCAAWEAFPNDGFAFARI